MEKLLIRKVLWPRKRPEEELVDQAVFAFLTRRDLSLRDLQDKGYVFSPVIDKSVVIYFYAGEPICEIDYTEQTVSIFPHNEDAFEELGDLEDPDTQAIYLHSAN